MPVSRWLVLASLSLLAGGLSWLIKIGVIVGTDGRVITTGPAAMLMSSGIIFLLLGAAAAGVGLAREAHLILRVVAAFGAAAVLVACCVAVGWAASRLADGYGPAYVAQEIGIFVDGLLWFAIGIVGLRRVQRTSASAHPQPA